MDDMLLADWLRLYFLVAKIEHIVTEKLRVTENMLHQAWLVHSITITKPV